MPYFPPPAGGVSDGDKGDIVVTGSGATWTLEDPIPAKSGANLTNLDATDLGSGTVPTARLGSGTPDTTTFLRGDQTWAAPTASIAAPFKGNYATGSFTTETGKFALQGGRLTLASSERATLEGTGRLIISG